MRMMNVVLATRKREKKKRFKFGKATASTDVLNVLGMMEQQCTKVSTHAVKCLICKCDISGTKDINRHIQTAKHANNAKSMRN